MQIISKTKALELLSKTLSDIDTLPPSGDEPSKLAPWNSWARTTNTRIAAVFGDSSDQSNEIRYLIDELLKHAVCSKRLLHSAHIVGLIGSFYKEIEDLWEEEHPENGTRTSDSAVVENVRPKSIVINNKVFIVHGHDHGRMQAVARFLEQLGLDAIVLHERASKGSTIIEKLESHSEVGYAVVLLTPDDIGAAAKDKETLRPRARQNVVLELGYFLAKLGRRKTCALVVENIEVPSDYSGVVYITIDKGGAWKFHLAKELRAAGFSIDVNKVL